MKGVAGRGADTRHTLNRTSFSHLTPRDSRGSPRCPLFCSLRGSRDGSCAGYSNAQGRAEGEPAAVRRRAWHRRSTPIGFSPGEVRWFHVQRGCVVRCHAAFVCSAGGIHRKSALTGSIPSPSGDIFWRVADDAKQLDVFGVLPVQRCSQYSKMLPYVV